MPRRSPWATQPKQKRRELVRQFSKLSDTEAGRVLQWLVANPRTVSRQEKIAFIQKNARLVARTIKAKSGVGSNLIQTGIRGKLDHAPEAVLDGLFGEALSAYMNARKKEVKDAFVESAENYLKERGIRVQSEADQKALTSAVFGQAWESKESGPKKMLSLDLPRIEREFLSHQKMERKNAHFFSNKRNRIIGLLSEDFFKKSGRRLTSNQQKSLKKWVNRELEKVLAPSVLTRGISIQKPGEPQEALARTSLVVERMIDGLAKVSKRAQEEMIKPWFPVSEKKRGAPVSIGTSGYRKEGTGVERRRAYVPGKEEISPKTIREIQTRQAVSQAVGVRFDPTPSLLAAIREKKPSSEVFYSRLLKQKQLQPGQFVQLVTAGPLAMRLFEAAVSKTDLVEEKGDYSVGACAGIMAYIGNHGRNISATEGFFVRRGWYAVYEFLKKKNFFEMGHTRGEVLYLRRRAEEIGN